MGEGWGVWKEDSKHTGFLKIISIVLLIFEKICTNFYKKNERYCYARTLLERGDLSRKEKKDREGPREIRLLR